MPDNDGVKKQNKTAAVESFFQQQQFKVEMLKKMIKDTLLIRDGAVSFRSKLLFVFDM